MTKECSFTKYVESKCINELCEASVKYINDNFDSLDIYTRNVQTIGEFEITDSQIKKVYAYDLPGMMVGFDVAVEVELCVREADYHYDEEDVCKVWIRICCEGDLSKGLEGWKINEIRPYEKETMTNSLTDALVPYIANNQIEDEAVRLLGKYYPEALKITSVTETPTRINPYTLASRLNLNIFNHRIYEDGSTFGQLYFDDADTYMYEVDINGVKRVHISGRTIVVDPINLLLRNFGSVNNTIVHECVHWIEHRKAFMLEKLYDSEASHISCSIVEGPVPSGIYSSIDAMEWQANQLTPRILMPKEPFKVKAKEYIAQYMQEINANHTYEVMERVIAQLASDFGVSKLSSKLRLSELGFDEVIGTYTYLDNHYVQPHGFKKGSVKVNQTFSISAQDAAIERHMNRTLFEMTESGDYLFIDNHFVYNTPKYVEKNGYGHLDLTEYARSHMDECCLIFDIKIKNNVRKEFHTVCYLNRESSNNDITIQYVYHNGYENECKEEQIELHKRKQEEYISLRKQMTDDPGQCLNLLLEWKGINYTDLVKTTGISDRTFRRIKEGKNVLETKNAAKICFALNLPPILSEKLLGVLGVKFVVVNTEHQWIKEALTTKYADSYEDICAWLAQFDVII